MIRIYVLAAVLLSACQTSGPKDIDRGNKSLAGVKPGAVIHQSSRKLENGFYDVSKSIVNSPDHWEGIMHLGYIYHKKTEICRCSESLTVRSPNGKYIVYYSNKNERLEVFNTRSKEVTSLSDKYTGHPQTAKWDLNAGTASVYLSQPNFGETKELKITLD